MKKYCFLGCAMLALSFFASAQDNMLAEQNKWILKSLEGKEIEYRSNQQKAYLIVNAENKTASGFSGCNGFGATINISGNKLTISNIMATQKGCLDNNIEPLFFEALSKIDVYILAENTLTLLKNDHPLAVFTLENESDLEYQQKEEDVDASKDPVIHFTKAEVPAVFEGEGLDAFVKWVKDRMTAEPADINDRGLPIIISFVVNKCGNVENISIVRGVDPNFDSEVLKIVGESPKWEPAQQNSQPISVEITIPIKFYYDK